MRAGFGKYIAKALGVRLEGATKESNRRMKEPSEVLSHMVYRDIAEIDDIFYPLEREKN